MCVCFIAAVLFESFKTLPPSPISSPHKPHPTTTSTHIQIHTCAHACTHTHTHTHTQTSSCFCWLFWSGASVTILLCMSDLLGVLSCHCLFLISPSNGVSDKSSTYFCILHIRHQCFSFSYLWKKSSKKFL